MLGADGTDGENNITVAGVQWTGAATAAPSKNPEITKATPGSGCVLQHQGLNLTLLGLEARHRTSRWPRNGTLHLSVSQEASKPTLYPEMSQKYVKGGDGAEKGIPDINHKTRVNKGEVTTPVLGVGTGAPRTAWASACAPPRSQFQESGWCSPEGL